MKSPEYNWMDYARFFQEKHSLFYAVYSMGEIYFDERIPTAAVTFDKDGYYINFLFNPKFWDSLDDYNRCFVIAHEALHFILEHGLRTKNLRRLFSDESLNVALDVVVNEILVTKFGFIKCKIKNWDKYCWIDTVFKESGKYIHPYKNFEYYLNQLPRDLQYENLLIVDDHSFLDSSSETISEENKDRLIKEILKKISNNDKKDVLSSLAGDIDGTSSIVIQLKKAPPKEKWESVVKKWTLLSEIDEYEEIENFIFTNRRFIEAFQDDEVFIPTFSDFPKNKKNRVDVWFFQDTSGSCQSLAKRFFAAAKSLPPSRFEVKMHCFDTRVYETDLKSGKLYGFGGTSFTCIEQYIQQKVKKDKIDYPKLVFVITDGYGDVVNPEKPKVWHWFLSHNYKHCIPKESYTHMLSDFE